MNKIKMSLDSKVIELEVCPEVWLTSTKLEKKQITLLFFKQEQAGKLTTTYSKKGVFEV